jgi:phospholipid/cholesterol/gamma-HCH transport system substrate-binding protein
MAQQANPKLIGAFVLGAIALLAIGLVIFGGLSWLNASRIYIAYFPGSVKGLRPGAPVDFRGVQIGQVTDIRIRFNAVDGSMQIPVLMRFDPNRITVIGRERVIETRADLQELIKRGLRAQLETQSIVTGLLSINLDFYPNAPLNLVGGQSSYPELPTIPSTMEAFQQTLGDVTQEIPGLLKNTNLLLTDLSQSFGANKGEIQQILDQLASITEGIDKATPALGQTVDTLQTSAATVNDLLQSNKEAIGNSLQDLDTTLSAVRRMTDQVNNMVAENREGLHDFTSTGLYEITGLAQDAQRMVDQINRVTQQLERDPARFLFGDRAAQGVRAP